MRDQIVGAASDGGRRAIERVAVVSLGPVGAKKIAKTSSDPGRPRALGSTLATECLGEFGKFYVSAEVRSALCTLARNRGDCDCAAGMVEVEANSLDVRAASVLENRARF